MKTLVLHIVLFYAHLLQWTTCAAEINTTAPTMEPTLEPTDTPTFFPSTATPAPTTFPTETPADISFIETVCLSDDGSRIIQYNAALPIDSIYDDTVHDVLTIDNVNVPLIKNYTSNPCYLHIYLSNNNDWGYRHNATCGLSYTIEPSMPLQDILLDLYNILDINKRYNTFWKVSFLSATSFLFGSHPICQSDSKLMDQDIHFGRMNVFDVIENTGFHAMSFNSSFTSTQKPVTLPSSDGLWPYYFLLLSEQTDNQSLFRMNLAFDESDKSHTGETCVFDEALPTYDGGIEDVEGGIDYYLFMYAINAERTFLESQDNLHIALDIKISQNCTTQQPYDAVEKEMGGFFTLGTWIIIGFLICFVIMAVLNTGLNVYEKKTYDQTNTSGSSLDMGMPADFSNEYAKEEMDNTEAMETERARFVVDEEDHVEMVKMMQQGSDSCGLR
eukprot:207873_1